jgi:hypothetical protein
MLLNIIIIIQQWKIEELRDEASPTLIIKFIEGTIMGMDFLWSTAYPICHVKVRKISTSPNFNSQYYMFTTNTALILLSQILDDKINCACS